VTFTGDSVIVSRNSLNRKLPIAVTQDQKYISPQIPLIFAEFSFEKPLPTAACVII
jgi:hypothetical protein